MQDGNHHDHIIRSTEKLVPLLQTSDFCWRTTAQFSEQTETQTDGQTNRPTILPMDSIVYDKRRSEKQMVWFAEQVAGARDAPLACAPTHTAPTPSTVRPAAAATTMTSTAATHCKHKVTIVSLHGASSPVNHKRLYQRWKQTSIYLPVNHSTSHYNTSIFFSNHNSERRSRKTNNNNNNKKAPTCIGAYLYSAGTQHRNLHQLSVTMNRVTCSILRAHTETGVSHSQHRTNSGVISE